MESWLKSAGSLLGPEMVRFFEGMQSHYFNIFPRAFPAEVTREQIVLRSRVTPVASSARRPFRVTIGTMKDSYLWIKNILAMLRYALPKKSSYPASWREDVWETGHNRSPDNGDLCSEWLGGGSG